MTTTALMIATTQHAANPADPSKIDILLTFRLTGQASDLGTIDALATIASTDTPAGILAKIKTAVIARAAEYGVSLAADSINPILFGRPVSPAQVVFAQTVVQAGDRIANTSSTTLFATKYTIPANTMVAGQMIKISASGEFGTPLVASRTFDSLQFAFGGSLFVGVGSKTPSGVNIVGATWTFVGVIICVTDGPSGTIEGSGLWTFADNTAANLNDQVWANATDTPFSLDTTIDNDITLGVRYFTADPANFIQMRHLTVVTGT